MNIFLLILVIVQFGLIVYLVHFARKGQDPIGVCVVHHVGDEGGKRFSLEFNEDFDPYDIDTLKSVTFVVKAVDTA